MIWKLAFSAGPSRDAQIVYSLTKGGTILTSVVEFTVYSLKRNYRAEFYMVLLVFQHFLNRKFRIAVIDFASRSQQEKSGSN